MLGRNRRRRGFLRAPAATSIRVPPSVRSQIGLFAPRNASVMAALLVAAFALAGPIFMMLEMDQPYGGLVKIPSSSLRVALDQLGRS
jgi:hypothetical protein